MSKKKLTKTEIWELGYVALTIKMMQNLYETNPSIKKVIDKAYKKKIKELKKS